MSGSYFGVLGAGPLLDRTFTPADDRRGGGPDGPVAVISYTFWQQRFAGATLAAVRTIAGWIPARRASRIDPAVVLRQQGA